MSTKETVIRKITIDYTDCNIGIQELEAEVITHLHDIDGSQLIVLKTPRRENVEEFLHNELVVK